MLNKWLADAEAELEVRFSTPSHANSVNSADRGAVVPQEASIGPFVTIGSHGAHKEDAADDSRSLFQAPPVICANSADSVRVSGEAPSEWLVLYRERLRSFSSYGYAQAQRMAWNSVALAWSRENRDSISPDFCSGCGESLDGGELLVFPTGERVHLTDGYDCIIRHAKLWKSDAAAALEAEGVRTPAEIIAEIRGVE